MIAVLVSRTQCSVQRSETVHRRSGTATSSTSDAIPGLQHSIACCTALRKRGIDTL
jgi:hypothetical protein